MLAYSLRRASACERDRNIAIRRMILPAGRRWFYFVIQASTALILVLAANTAFADFPRLSSLLANDRFMPRQFSNRVTNLSYLWDRCPVDRGNRFDRGFRR